MVDRAPTDEDLLSEWAPRSGRARARRRTPDPAPSRADRSTRAAEPDGRSGAAGSPALRLVPVDRDGWPDDGWPELDRVDGRSAGDGSAGDRPDGPGRVETRAGKHARVAAPEESTGSHMPAEAEFWADPAVSVASAVPAVSAVADRPGGTRSDLNGGLETRSASNPSLGRSSDLAADIDIDTDTGTGTGTDIDTGTDTGIYPGTGDAEVGGDHDPDPGTVSDSDSNTVGPDPDPGSGTETDGDTGDPDAGLVGAAGDGAPVRARAHRINGRWGRFAELWVPESMRDARVDPGRRGMLVLVLVAAVAAVVAAVGVWRDRPEPRPIETAVVAVASGQPAVQVSEAAPSPAAAVGPAGASTAAPSSGPAGPPATEILVSVTGLVTSPGVVRLAPDARVADAIAAAGGTQPGADLTGMNLAARLADGDSVVVTDAGATGPGTAGSAGGSGSTGGGDTATAPAGGPVNLNTADEAALDTLPGVGPVMAKNILAWRETNGRFATVEQLQEISGIGPSRFAQLAPLVTVG